MPGPTLPYPLYNEKAPLRPQSPRPLLLPKRSAERTHSYVYLDPYGQVPSLRPCPQKDYRGTRNRTRSKSYSMDQISFSQAEQPWRDGGGSCHGERKWKTVRRTST